MSDRDPHASDGHAWQFARFGGVDQVVFRTGADLTHLRTLDLTLWMALAMPTRGTALDPKTADLIDADRDGRIRPPELIAAVDWTCAALTDPALLLQGGDAIPIAAIKDSSLRDAAKRVLTNLGKSDETDVALADLADTAKLFGNTLFNGDGVIAAEAADDPSVRSVIEAVVSVMGPVADRSGKPGVDRASADAFFTQARAYVEWAQKAESDPDLVPLGIDDAASALDAVRAVRAKIDDYFARCRITAFDTRAVDAMNREVSEYQALAVQDLTLDTKDLAALPLARVGAGRPLPLDKGVNPAWAAALRRASELAITPLIGPRTSIDESEWAQVEAKLAPFESWMAARPSTAIGSLGVSRLRDIVTGGAAEAIGSLIERDSALAGETGRIGDVEKLLRFKRDLHALLLNFVNFSIFYGRERALFQAGTLYLDARACDLCIDVADASKHATLAGLSNACLVYCDLTRPGGRARSIVAVFTDGDSDMLMAGRNGVFYDRDGADWDATVAKVISNPISIREAFWLPYKKLVRFIEDQIAKRAQAADAASSAKLEQTATIPAAPATPKKLDLGTIALIGTAIGGMSALVGGFLQALFGLGFWLPLGVVGVLMMISGPSMLLAWMKLRTRNLGPILDANGWAINTRALINVPFGASLTRIAVLPPGAQRPATDPFASKRRPWALVAAVLIALVAVLWILGRLDGFLPASLCRTRPVAAPAATADSPTP